MCYWKIFLQDVSRTQRYVELILLFIFVKGNKNPQNWIIHRSIHLKHCNFFKKRHVNFEKMVTNLMFKIITIASDHFFRLWGNLWITRQKNDPFYTKFVRSKTLFKKVRIPSMQTCGRRMASSLVNKPHESAAPVHAISLSHEWRLFHVSMQYHRENENLFCLNSRRFGIIYINYFTRF